VFRFLFGFFLVLHGLVHLWYFTLSQGLVEFQTEMGWTGRSWLLSNFLGDSISRSLAGVFYVLATIAFLVSGIGLFTNAEWLPPVLAGSAVFSSAVILLFWDGNSQMLVQKGFVGLLINVVILIALLVLK
jgi:hypothetical protein